MKKKILYIAAILICLSIITGGTFAYFTTEDTARNVITTGGVEMQIVEQQLVNGQLQPWENPAIPVMPATRVSKIVSVKNTQQNAWVRANFSVTVYDFNGEKMNIPAEELTKVIIINPNTKNWAEKDGWWYYKSVMKTNQTSSPLFEEVAFSGPHMDNKYQNCTVTIDITAQAVQQTNNGKTIWEAAGWPEA